jgi:regulator of RNase E activity RraA
MIDGKSLYSGVVYDALRELSAVNHVDVLSLDVRPLDNDSWCYGPAFTCAGWSVQPDRYTTADRFRLKMYDAIPRGSVVVLQAEGNRVSHSGDVTSLIYRQLGVAGFVTDGLVRDSRLIRQHGLPCFCRGQTPVDAVACHWVIAEYGNPITLARVSIFPGDWIYGDCDGVLRIPADVHEDFEKVVARRIEHEQWVRTEIRDGPHDLPLTQRIRQCYEEGRW